MPTAADGFGESNVTLPDLALGVLVWLDAVFSAGGRHGDAFG
jgi:hypothetical protein